MSTVESAVKAVDEVCASCGTAALDNVKLKKCPCLLVRYCSTDCQKNHRPHHKKACKKRLAEIREDLLFRQPESSHLGDCPICCLPMPLSIDEWGTNSCCCKRLCNGCTNANRIREVEASLKQRCPFCREPMPKSKEEVNSNYVDRAEANDPIALTDLGKKRDDEGDYEGAFEYYTKAAELGGMEAHLFLYRMYSLGEGVEKNEKKALYHLEEAAIGGHAEARYDLGNHEGRNRRIDRALKHMIIAANLGYDRALKFLEKEGLAKRWVSREDFDAARRGHQAAVDATKSQQRDAAYAYQQSRQLQQMDW